MSRPACHRRVPAAAALESTAPPSRVRLVNGYRKDHAPRPLLHFDPRHLPQALNGIRDRVRRHQRAGFRSYLFIDNDLAVFVLSDMQSVLTTWLRDHGDWLVGTYVGQRMRGPDRMREDIAAHLEELAQ